MPIDFEWDSEKEKTNIAKHGVDFTEAATIFIDAFAITIYDQSHSHQEDRYITLGLSNRFRIIVVVHTDREDKIRMISARKATRYEQEQYDRNR